MDCLKISLKAARVNSGLTQSAAAKIIGVNRTTLLKYENGKTIPNIAILKAMAAAYVIPLENLTTVN